MAAAGDLWRAARAMGSAFAGYAGPRAWHAAALVAAGALLEGVSIALLVPILGVVVGGSGTMAWLTDALAGWGVVSTAARLAALITGFIVLMALRALVLFRRDLALAALETGFVEHLRNRVMRALARAPWSRVAALRHARVANLLGAEMGRVAASTHFLVQGAVALAMLAIQGTLALALAPWIALGTAAALAVGGALVLASGRRTRDLGGNLVRASEAMMGSAAGFLGGLKAAAAENAGPRFAEEFALTQAELRSHNLAFVARSARARLAFGLASAVAAAAVVVAGVATGLAPAVLITLILVFARMTGPALTIQASLQNLFFGLPSFEAAQALELELGTADPQVTATEPPAGPIVLEDVRYIHAGGGGLSDASVTLPEGSFIGVEGPSGAGKTSFADVVAGLVTPQAGTVRIGGLVLDEGRRAGWRNRVGYVPQDGFLFHESVRRNLAWGAPDANDAQIAQALRTAQADGVVAGLEHGLDTLVGERGARLSGGERQRIAIARALLRRPRLLVLDEATNALDPATEAALLDALTRLSPRPTVVMIAHRASSLARCDRVLRIESGRLTG